ncbi:hypothetical protein Pmani_038873 [Petrolisthes manimaculis]|uniref:Uncharacterized protein n=1 Tax=Petrolisthes manimaculis TaxID=1843537 RepID=A0AAE1NFD7_9EUCA|nr:hypothetical protein Pmani_038873 [Petrolisthes manimaculis]
MQHKLISCYCSPFPVSFPSGALRSPALVIPGASNPSLPLTHSPFPPTSLHPPLGRPVNSLSPQYVCLISAAGLAIEKLCETAEANMVEAGVVGVVGGGSRPEYRASMIRAARCLLSSVTRVLLLADTVVVKQLLLAKDKCRGHIPTIITFP